MSGVKVLMTTYEPGGGYRAEYARLTLEALIQHLNFTGPLSLHVADDGSPSKAFITPLINRAEKSWHNSASWSDACRGGIGASLNLAFQDINPGWLWFYITDDWVLTERLNLDIPVMLIEELGYDMVRLGPTHPNLCCETKFQEGIGWWLEVDTSQGGYAFATRPFVATKDFYDRIGPFDEGLDSYETERRYAERVCKQGARVACLHLDGPWTHIGIHTVGKTSTGLVAV